MHYTNKGGVNPKPTTKRPPPPKGQGGSSMDEKKDKLRELLREAGGSGGDYTRVIQVSTEYCLLERKEFEEQISELEKERDKWKKRTEEADEEYYQRKGRYVRRIRKLEEDVRTMTTNSLVACRAAYKKGVEDAKKGV